MEWKGRIKYDKNRIMVGKSIGRGQDQRRNMKEPKYKSKLYSRIQREFVKEKGKEKK
jgi:hypothetical protein